MAKRKRERSLRREDPAARYRAKLALRRAAAQQAEVTRRTARQTTHQLGRWSPGVQGRLALAFARLLRAATAPATGLGGLRKRLLERWLFRALTRHAAHRKALYRASGAVLNAAKARNPETFERSRGELRGLWRQTRANRRAGKPR